jgi:hypothetical protein
VIIASLHHHIIAGFSMGGSMAVIVASLPRRYPGLRFVLVGGARDLPPALLEDLLQAEEAGANKTGTNRAGAGVALLPLPSLHLIGAADKVVPPESSRQLAGRFLAPRVIEHEQGHCIP